MNLWQISGCMDPNCGGFEVPFICRSSYLICVEGRAALSTRLLNRSSFRCRGCNFEFLNRYLLLLAEGSRGAESAIGNLRELEN